MTDPRPSRFAVPLARLEGTAGERVSEVGDARDLPDWSGATSSTPAADADGE